MKRIFVLVSIVFLSACGAETQKEGIEEELEYEEEGLCEGGDFDEDMEEVYVPNPVTFYGYIGNESIKAEIDFHNNSSLMTGEFSYDNSPKTYSLKGDQIEWYGGPIYEIEVYNENEVKIGYWRWFCQKTTTAWEGYFDQGAEIPSYSIILLPTLDEQYLHPKSKFVFESKKEADNFFATHNFLNEDLRGKKGIIVSNDEEYYGNMLPEGLTIYGHDGSDGFGAEPIGTINAEGKIELDSGEEISTWDYGMKEETAVGYERFCLRFHEVITPGFITILMEEYNEAYISIDELEELNFHLEGDGHWIKEKSGNVLGFFPAYIKKGDDYFRPEVVVYSEMSEESNSLFAVTDDELGFFSLEDVVFDGEFHWAKVTFNYHTEVPCSDEIREAQPSITGWIDFYYGYEPVLGYYSKGC